MEECESLDTQMEELQEFQCESSDIISQDDEDEVEELQNSLREVVQDQSVKPKLQCLMVDPSFSMVTVQSEDSGIIWETASSRCSTPWASETSSTSDAYSMEGSGAAGKITIVFDEEKIVRRRTRSGGRSSRLGDRLSRPGSSRSASALGVERPEMAEVSLPNVKVEQSKTEPDLEEIKSKDQQLFSLISEGYEILNIRVPSKLPTVDEEESTELQDNLSYLDQTPQIRSRNHFDWTQQDHVLPEETQDQQELLTQETEQEQALTPTPKESTTDIDYFEKFTLLDEVVPGEQAPEQQEEAEQPGAKPQEEEQKPAKEPSTESPTASEESFVFVTDVEIVGEHLDEVFYGEGPPADSLHHLEAEEEERMRTRRESQRSTKENGSLLFGREETILTPIYISAGPPKIIDQILLDEPTAMSFMYSDLYEDAVGERKKSDEEHSEAESVVSERSYRRRFSDPEEAPDGYLEKFTLKDEIPLLDIQTESVEEKKGGRMMWPQSKFEMTGCLIRAVDEDEKEETKAEEPKMEESSAGHQSEDLPSAVMEEKRATAAETQEEREEEKEQVAIVVQEQAEKETADEGSQLMEEKMEIQQVNSELKDELPEPAEELPEAPQEDCEIKDRKETEDQQEEEVKSSEKKEVLEVTTEQTAVTSVSSEAVPVLTKPETQTETSEEAPPDTKKLAAEEEVVTEATEDASAAAKEPERVEQETLTSTEPPTAVLASPETSSSCEGTEAAEVIPEDAAPIEVTTDSDCAMQTIVEVTEKAVNEKEIQTQVQIDLQELTSEEKTNVLTETPEEKPALESVTEEVTAEKLPEIVGKDVEMEISSEVTKPVMPEEVKAESEEKISEVLETEQQILELTEAESDQTKLVTEEKSSDATEEAGSSVQDVVNVGDELIVFVPRGQAVEMDIQVSQWSEKATEDVVTEPESQSELPAPAEEIKIEPPTEDKPEVAVMEELPRNEAESECPPAELVETEGNELKAALEEDKVIVSPLRSFSPQEDLPELHQEEIQSEDVKEEQKLAEIEAEKQVAVMGQLPQNEVESECPPPEPVKEPHTAEKELESEEDKLIVSPLRSFTPLEDLSKEEIQPEDVEVEQELKTEEEPQKDLDGEHRPDEPVKEPETTEQELEHEFEEDKKIMSSLRSFTPLEDLSALHKEEIEPEEAETDQKLETHKTEGEPEIAVKEEEPQKDSGSESRAPEPLEEPQTEEQIPEPDLEEDTAVATKLRSFAPLEDLSGLHGDDVLSEAAAGEQKLELYKIEDEPEIDIIKEDIVPDVDLHREATEQKTEQEEAIADAPEVLIDELEYEVITKQDVPEMPEYEEQKDAEEQKLEPVLQQKEEKEETRVEKEDEAEVSPEEELIEAEYDIIDAEEESQARLAAELQGMDWFCVTCGRLLSEEDCVSGGHQDHEVDSVDKAYEDIKETLSGWISELQGRSENIEDLVSELELAYNSVEDQCVESEAAMQAQNEEMMAQVMEQYNNMSISMEEEKKAKLEQLYDQIVSFQESIDSTKATLETTSREAETDARSPEDIQERLRAALDSALSLELGPKGLLVFEDYAKANTSSSNLTQRKGIPVPQRPTLQPQEPGSATSTSVTVYWRVNPGDVIDCFQVYCMEDPQGAITEEYRVTVKESYCVLEELSPDKMYKVWVMAVNYTGCSLPSERLIFQTAPSVPAVDTERCTVLWDSATLRWSSPTQAAGQSYTLEYCRQYELEGEGLRSISGIGVCEQKVILQPNENYLFYIKAVNEAGVSEQSEAALISTKGTRFHLLSASAHPALELSEDRTTVHYSQDAHRAAAASDKQCPSILGDLLPARGLYYWETAVSGCAAFRLGVAHSTANRNVPLGENSLTWCLQCVPSPSGCRYQLLHNDIQASVLVTETPERVGTLLDYQQGRLSFYNTQGGQLLGSFSWSFTQPCHPALALELPGSLAVSTVLEVPEFTKDS